MAERLVDLVRQAGVDVRDVIAQLDRKLLDLSSQRTGIEQTKFQIQNQLTGSHQAQAFKRREVEQRQLEVQELNNRIEAIEQQRQQLNLELLGTIEQLQENKIALSDLDDETSKDQVTLRRSEQELESLARQFDETSSLKETYNNRLSSQYSAILRQYLQSVGKEMNEVFRDEHLRQQTFESSKRLRESRHSDKEVGDLCDARDEWQNVVKSVQVPAVKQIAIENLATIELRLEELFPGALKAGTMKLDHNPIFELHYTPLPNGTDRIYLPIDIGTWENIATAKLAEKSTLFLCWALPKVIKNVEAPKMKLMTEENGVTLEISDPEWLLPENQAPVIQLPGGGSMSFVFSPLPAEMQEVML